MMRALVPQGGRGDLRPRRPASVSAERSRPLFHSAKVLGSGIWVGVRDMRFACVCVRPRLGVRSWTAGTGLTRGDVGGSW